MDSTPSYEALPNPPMSPIGTDHTEMQAKLEALGFKIDSTSQDWDAPAQSNEMYPDSVTLFDKTYSLNAPTRFRARTLLDNAITWVLSLVFGCDKTPYQPATSLETTAREALWVKMNWWIRTFSYMILGVISFGIFLAHIFIILGYAWTDCLEPPQMVDSLRRSFSSGPFRVLWPCVLTFHLLEVPITIYCAYFAWYGLFKLKNDGPISNLAWYRSLLRWIVVVIAAYFCVEGISLMMLVNGQALLRSDPLTQAEWDALKPVVPYQTVGLIFVCSSMISGMLIGIHIESMLVQYLNPAPSPLYWYPGDEAQLRSLVKWAGSTSRRLRTVGSSHSVLASIHVTPTFLASGANFDLEIGMRYYRRIRAFHPLDADGVIDHNRLWVEAQGGIYLGKNPNDPKSTWESSLCGLLNSLTVGTDASGKRNLGLSLPDLGGITHQTVAGFLSTASAGGSTKHDLYRTVKQVRFVDGNGQIVVLTRPDEDIDGSDPYRSMQHPFYAVVGSIGMLGVISTVTFEFDLHRTDKHEMGSLTFWGIGNNTVAPVDEAVQPSGKTAVTCTVDKVTINLTPDVAKAGSQPLRKWLSETPYARILFWPQAEPTRLAVWQCKPVMTKPSKLSPYQPIAKSGIGSAFLQSIYGDIYRMASHARLPWPKSLRNLITGVVNLGQSFGTKKFADVWYRALPMDNDIKDDLMPTEFTEMWIPISQCDAVFATLFKYLEGDKGWDRKGSFPMEVYCATASPFWMSPAFATGEPVVRLDLFWFKDHFTDPAVFYRQYWKLFQETAGLDVRFHLGKHMPLLLPRLVWLDTVQQRARDEGKPLPWKTVWIEKIDGSTQWRVVEHPRNRNAAYQVPTWIAGQRRFELLRRVCDPNNVFPNQYWEERMPMVNVNRDFAALGDWDIGLVRLALEWNNHDSKWLAAVTEFLDLNQTIDQIKQHSNEISSVPSVHRHFKQHPERLKVVRGQPANGLRMRGPIAPAATGRVA